MIYGFGHDYWMYQRFAYRIVMQGYWLEGGSTVFYFQPFYRWIVGLLHVVFGDSSAGEWYWDGACLLAGALLSFRIARTFAGFRWGLVAAASTLARLRARHRAISDRPGPQRDLVRGAAEHGRAAAPSTAAIAGRPSAIGAGVLATLAFYTRLNNLIMAAGVALFALPLRPAGARPAPASRVVAADRVANGGDRAGRHRRRPAAVRVAHVALHRRVQPLLRHAALYRLDLAARRAARRVSLQRLAHSVMLVLTVNDPPRFDPYALPILAGAAVAVLSLAGTPRLRDLPAAAVLFFFASIAGAFVAAGWTYTGRFSVHVMPITCALTVCGVARLLHNRRTIRSRDVDLAGSSRAAVDRA